MCPFLYLVLAMPPWFGFISAFFILKMLFEIAEKIKMLLEEFKTQKPLKKKKPSDQPTTEESLTKVVQSLSQLTKEVEIIINTHKESTIFVDKNDQPTVKEALTKIVQSLSHLTKEVEIFINTHKESIIFVDKSNQPTTKGVLLLNLSHSLAQISKEVGLLIASCTSDLNQPMRNDLIREVTQSLTYLSKVMDLIFSVNKNSTTVEPKFSDNISETSKSTHFI